MEFSKKLKRVAALTDNNVFPGLATTFFGDMASGREDKTHFIVAGHPRCGSTFLMSLLNAHPRIVCMHELLRMNTRKPVFQRFHLGQREKLLQLREIDIEAFLEKAFFVNPVFVQAIGFKALYGFPNSNFYPEQRIQAWDKLAGQKKLKVVYLNRNLLRTYVSRQLAMNSKEWMRIRAKESRWSWKKITIDPDHCLRYLNRASSFEKEVRAKLNHHASIELEYDYLARSSDVEMTRILQFLGVKEKTLSSNLQRQNPRPIYDLVENYAELEKALRSTSFQTLVE